MPGDTPKNAQSEFSFAAGIANGENTDRSRSNIKDFNSAFLDNMKGNEKIASAQMFQIDGQISSSDVKVVSGTSGAASSGPTISIIQQPRTDTILEQSQENLRSTE